ncbi:MAG: sensor histidine kinase [Ginsengibacter sp.]
MKKSIVVLLHIGYWVIYLFLVTMLLMVLSIYGKHQPSRFFGGLIFGSPLSLGAFLPALLGFYTSYFFLFDKYLKNKKIFGLFLSEIVAALMASLITEAIIYLLFHNKRINWDSNDIITLGLFLSFIAIVNGATGLVLKGFINWFNDIKFKLELAKKNYEMELALVKSQINPHFLFNTINNIDVLISKDASRASAYLNKLSDIMRFMLYETKPAKINLHKELTYIEKFIELQKIRTTNEHYINYSIKGDPANFMIPPMLLICFIENAFKHAENKKVENAINIHLDIEKEKLLFQCENAYNENTKITQEQSGLGSDLIKKRLALLYPEKHALKITNNNGMYKVALSLY